MRLRSAAILALVAAGNAALAGCGAPAWPTATGLADPAFVAGQRSPRTIDLLPVDVQTWTIGAADPEPIAGALRGLTTAAVTGELARRGYHVVAAIGQDGAYADDAGARHLAMAPDALAATRYALSSYGLAQADAGDAALVLPFLPHRLGAATGSDATLHIAGWAFAGERPRSTGEKVGKAVLIGAAVVLVVGLIVVLAVAGDGDGGGGLGGVAAGAGKVAAGAAKVAGQAIGVAGRAAVGAGRATLALGHAVLRSGHAVDLALQVGDAVVELADVHHRPHTHIARVAARPDYARAPGAPHRGRSRMLFELTLIDNHTGAALWHVRQQVAADPRRPRDVERAVHGLLASLPTR